MFLSQTSSKSFSLAVVAKCMENPGSSSIVIVVNAVGSIAGKDIGVIKI